MIRNLAKTISSATFCFLLISGVALGQKSIDQGIEITTVGAKSSPGIAIVIHESFLSKWIKQSNSECGRIRDRVMEAQVYGGQCTASVSDIELIESKDSARFQIVLKGATRNRTVSYTRQASIESRGIYSFQSRKHVHFDGHKLQSWWPRTAMNINHQNVAATTNFDGFPILGGIANRTALRAADNRQDYVRRNAAHRMQQSVIARFHRQVEDALSELNAQIESKVATILDQLHIDRTSIAARSLKDHIVIHIGGDAKQLAQANFDETFLPQEGIAFRVQQAYLNDLIESFPLAGLEIPDTILEQLNGFQQTQPVSLGGPKFGSLVLGEETPLSISLQNGLIVVEANVGFRPVYGPEVPLHRVVLHLQPELVGQQLSFGVTIDRLETVDSDETSVFELRLDSFNKMLASDSLFPPLPVKIPVTNENPDSPNALAVTGLQINQGWMDLALDASYDTVAEEIDAQETPNMVEQKPSASGFVASTGGE